MKKVGIASVLITVFLMVGAIAIPFPGNTFTSARYDFYGTEELTGYRCINGPYPTEFPTPLDTSECNRVFSDITDDGGLDWVDGEAVDSWSWNNYAIHHFFVVNGLEEETNKYLRINYEMVNKNGYDDKTFYLYVFDFDSEDWVLWDQEVVGPRDEGRIFDYAGWDDMSEYVNSEGEMWFMATQGPEAKSKPATDRFVVTIYTEDEGGPYYHDLYPEEPVA